MHKPKQYYKYIQHTADFGILVKANTLQNLFKIAAKALIKSAVKTTKINQTITEKLKLSAETLEDLFKAWLSRLLFLFSSQGKILVKINFFELTESKLDAELKGDIFNPTKYKLNTDLKAITYHKFYVKKTRNGYEAQFIVDV